LKAILCCSKHQWTIALRISMLVDGAIFSTMQWQLEMAWQSVTDCSVCVRWQIALIPAGTVLLAALSKNATTVFIATHCHWNRTSTPNRRSWHSSRGTIAELAVSRYQYLMLSARVSLYT
jgi:hypothetical protein